MKEELEKAKKGRTMAMCREEDLTGHLPTQQCKEEIMVQTRKS
jgi:hypothetical protein